MKRLLLFGCFLFQIISANSQVFITELADPNDAAACRFVELYNAGSTAVDFSTGWALQRYTNANASPQASVSLTGTIPAGGFYVVSVNSSSFMSCYGFAADQNIGGGGPTDSNGDDQIQLVNNGTVVDIFGVPGEDGSGTCHEFEDGRAERMASVTSGNPTFDESEWNVWADSSVPGCTSHTNSPQNAADMDPGAWIGEAPGNPTVSFAATTSSIAEGNSGTSTHTVDVTMNINPIAPVIVDITDAGTGDADNADFTYSTTQLTFGPTDTYPNTQSVSITISGDEMVEPDETIDLALAFAATNVGVADIGDDMHTVTITNEDVPTEVTFISAIANVTEGGSTDICVGIVNPSTANTTSVEIALTGGSATNGSDINPAYATQTVTFPANSSTPQCITINTFDDSDNEGAENLVFSLQNPTGGNSVILGTTTSATLNINDNDQVCVTIFSETFDEAIGSTSGTSAEGINWSANCPSCNSGDFYEVTANGFEGQDTNGPATWITDNITGLDAYEVIVLTLDFAGDDYAGSGNLESFDECGTCSGEIEDATSGSCNGCWDFLYLDADFGAVSSQQLLLGDGSATGGNLSQVLCSPGGFPATGTISLVMSMWASTENMAFDNILLKGYLTQADAQADGVSTTSCQAAPVLPVELMTFTARPTVHGSLLNWETASEKENDYFAIERSIDGKNYEVIGEIEGNGTSDEYHLYDFMDIRPAKGVNYYRLKQVDIDGTYSYSNVVSVVFDQSIEVSIRPNLVESTMTVEWANPLKNDTWINVYNLQGQVVFCQKIAEGDTNVTVNSSEWAAGKYFLRMNEGGEYKVLPFVKK